MNWKVFWPVFAKWLGGIAVAFVLALLVAVAAKFTDGWSSVVLIVVLFLEILRSEYKDALK